MGILKGADLDRGYPEHDWYTDMLKWFAEDAKTRGIDISYEAAGRQVKGKVACYAPTISFSGFYSQGDGLAFNCTINWPVFFETHEDFATSLPEWYLIISANPDIVGVGMTRNSRHEHQMSAYSEDESDTIEKGFFAGMEIEDTKLSFIDLEKYIEDVCEAEAMRMYTALEDEYDHQCEDIKERRIENTIEEHKDELHKVICWLLMQGDTFKTTALYIEEVSEDVCFSDLSDLGLVAHAGHNLWQVTDKGKELLHDEGRCAQTSSDGVAHAG